MEKTDQKLVKILEQAICSKERTLELARENERKGYWGGACQRYLRVGMTEKALEMAKKHEATGKRDDFHREQTINFYAALGDRKGFVRAVEDFSNRHGHERARRKVRDSFHYITGKPFETFGL